VTPARPRPAPIPEEKAVRIAKGHACPACGEYSYKKVVVRRASDAHAAELGAHWHAALVCGVCGAHVELGIAADGDVVYAG
jgi:transcription elongation factor Elf1